MPLLQMDKDIWLGVDRLDRKGEVTVEGQHNHVKRQVITLCDDTGDSLPLVLWDDQISISSLLRYVHYA